MHLKYFHDTVLSGHLGAWKTYHKIASNIWCSKMHFEIFSYVHKCDLCQRAKPAQGFRVGLHLASPVTVPMERLFIDFVGPLTRTKRGNIAILVLVDSFSKFVSFCPVRKMTSAAVSDYIGRYYFPTFGVTKSIVSDKAKPFCCKEYKDLFQVGVDNVTTTPYYRLASLEERVNRKLRAALKTFHQESQNTWVDDLPWLGIAFNTAMLESTRYTPDILFLGRELKRPLAVRWDLSPGSDVDNVSDTNRF